MDPTRYACSLDDQELAARREEWRALDERALLRSEPRPHGRLLVYQGGEEVERALAALIEAERGCCPWLGFDIDAWDGEVRVLLDFPPQARQVVDDLRP